MSEYTNTGFYNSAKFLSAADQKRFNSLFDNDRGIETVTASREGIYIEYNIYNYTEQLMAELLTKNGFIIMKGEKPGFIKRQIQYLAKSNYKNYGNRKPDCC